MNDVQLEARLKRILAATQLAAKPVLTVQEAATFTGRTVQSLYSLTKTRGIPHYKQGRVLYFKKTELEAWMLAHPVATLESINARAATYVATH
jgi:excisionase family DNA binding protein